mmetsp:Transcript_51049/g.136021  ORF Transcript_51049/g.136021 Transcript_51049/m.136021 type:complete len:216 (+) Transcript_51049:2-649(+)
MTSFIKYKSSAPWAAGKGGGGKGGGGGWQGTDNYSSYVAPPLRSSDRPTGVVKDEAAFQRYLSRPAQGGTSGAANLAPPAPRPSKGKGKGEDTEPRQQEAYTGAMASAASAAGAASEADGLGGGSHKSNKFNKIGTNEPGVGPQATKTSSTPRLDLLPPLRRAQFLQVVQRQVKSSGRHKEKQELAEEYLALCNGDYDEAYQYVKQLGENGAGLQ